MTEAVRASSAIPGIVRPVKLNGRWLIDGCLVNPIPVSVCRALGAHTVIAVNLTSEFGRGGIIVDDAVEEVERYTYRTRSCADHPLEWPRRVATAASPAVWPSPGNGAGDHIGDPELVQHFP